MENNKYSKFRELNDGKDDNFEEFGRRTNVQKIFLKIHGSLLRIIKSLMISMSVFIWLINPLANT